MVQSLRLDTVVPRVGYFTKHVTAMWMKYSFWESEVVQIDLPSTQLQPSRGYQGAYIL